MKCKITIGNKTIEVEKEKEDLLIHLESQGMPVKFGCLMGVCGVCTMKVLSGKENIILSDEHIIDLDEDEILLCCSKINGNVSLSSK